MRSSSRISFIKSNIRISPADSLRWHATAPARGWKWHLLRDSNSWADVCHHPTEELFDWEHHHKPLLEKLMTQRAGKVLWRSLSRSSCFYGHIPAAGPKGGWPLTLKQPWKQQMATQTRQKNFSNQEVEILIKAPTFQVPARNCDWCAAELQKIICTETDILLPWWR